MTRTGGHSVMTRTGGRDVATRTGVPVSTPIRKAGVHAARAVTAAALPTTRRHGRRDALEAFTRSLAGPTAGITVVMPTSGGL